MILAVIMDDLLHELNPLPSNNPCNEAVDLESIIGS